MAKERLIINGYKVPTGYSGVAVRAACEAVISNPGITQKELLEHAVKISGLNLSTAGWITSPSSKSPATLLWDRRKEGVFRCYPNAFTEQVIGSQNALREELRLWMNDICKRSRHIPVVGELVEVSTSIGQPYCEGIIIGFAFADRSMTSSSWQPPTSGIRSTPAEVFEEAVELRCSDRIEVILIENVSGRQRSVALGWNYRPI